MSTTHRVMPVYTLVHALYWSIYCLMLNYASVFLLNRGFTNSQIGLILGMSYFLSACMQPVLGSVFSRYKGRLNISVAGMYVPVAVLAFLIWKLDLEQNLLALLVILVFAMHTMLQPIINSMKYRFESKGIPVNYGMARGVGSASFSVTSLFVGRLLVKTGPTIIPGMYLGMVIVLIAVLVYFKVPEAEDTSGGAQKVNSSYFALLCGHPRFTLFLCGVICMFVTQLFIESFLLQIIMKMGGNSANLGIATAISALTEMPAMVIYSHVSRKINRSRLLCAAMWIWVAKDILTLLVRTPQALYAVQLLHFASCAVYMPAMMDFVTDTLPESFFMRGVSLAGTANTIGNLLATLLGGWLLDHMGVQNSLVLMQVFCICGAVMFVFAVKKPGDRKKIAA